MSNRHNNSEEYQQSDFGNRPTAHRPQGIQHTPRGTYGAGSDIWARNADGSFVTSEQIRAQKLEYTTSDWTLEQTNERKAIYMRWVMSLSSAISSKDKRESQQALEAQHGWTAAALKAARLVHGV